MRSDVKTAAFDPRKNKIGMLLQGGTQPLKFIQASTGIKILNYCRTVDTNSCDPSSQYLTAASLEPESVFRTAKRACRLCHGRLRPTCHRYVPRDHVNGMETENGSWIRDSSSSGGGGITHCESADRASAWECSSLQHRRRHRVSPPASTRYAIQYKQTLTIHGHGGKTNIFSHTLRAWGQPSPPPLPHSAKTSRPVNS